MSQFSIKNGSREVVVVSDMGRVSARLYVNNGETATLLTWNGKTEAGARKWADKTFKAHVGG